MFTLNNLSQTQYFDLIINGHVDITMTVAVLGANRLCRGTELQVRDSTSSSIPYLNCAITNIKRDTSDPLNVILTLTFLEYGNEFSA